MATMSHHHKRHWDPSLAIGDQAIDHQHQELFDSIFFLDRALESLDPSTELEKVLSFLEHYVADHFLEEEALMQKHRFEGYSEHRREHDIYRKKVSDIRDHFQTSRPLAHTVFAIRRLIDDMVAHVCEIDVKIAHLSGAKLPLEESRL